MQCSICLQRTVAPATIPTCLHMFCLDCISRWAAISLTCPLCKQHFDRVVHQLGPNRISTRHLHPPPSSQNPSRQPRRRHVRWGRGLSDSEREHERAVAFRQRVYANRLCAMYTGNSSIAKVPLMSTPF